MIEYDKDGLPFVRNSKLLIYNMKVPREVSNKTRQMGFKDTEALNCVVANLLACVKRGSVLVYGRDKAAKVTNKKSNRKEMNARRIIKVVDFLQEIGWCISYTGIKHEIESRRHPSILLHTDRFIDYWGLDCRVLAEIEMAHIDRTEVIELRGENKVSKPFKMNEEIKAMEVVVKRLNSAIANCDVRDKAGIPLNNVYCRIFNDDFKHGGRYYRADVLSIENGESKSRLDITIDGEMVVEVDYRNLHFRIAAHLDGHCDVELPHDVYSSLLEDSDNQVERKIVKLAINAMFNARSEEAARSAIQRAINSLKSEQWKQYTLGSAPAVMRLIKEVYYEFRHLFCQPDSFGLRLQNHDSELATDVITELLDNGVVCLPVHDSFVVKLSHRKLLEDTMANCFKRRFNTDHPVPLGLGYKVGGELIEEVMYV